MLETEAQGSRTVELAFIVFGPPSPHAGALINFDRSIQHDGGRRVAVVERRRIDKRFERRAGLAQRLGGAVELALVKREAADHRKHAPGPWILDHHGAGNLGYLVQDELALGFPRLDINDVTRADDLGHFTDRSPAGFGPFHSLERKNADGALLADKAARLATRLQPDTRGLVAGLKHHGQSPGRYVGQSLYFSESDSPVAGNIDLRDRAPPSLCLVVAHKTIDKRLACKQLKLWFKRRADGKTALVQLFLAVPLVKFAPNLLGEIFSSEDVRARSLCRHSERRALRFFGVGGLHEARFSHPIDNPIAPLDCALTLAERMIVVRRFGQRCEIGRFRNGEFVYRLVEIDKRCRGNAICTKPQVDFVQVKLKNLILAVGPLNLEGEQRLLDLARHRKFVGQQEVLGDLLRDSRSALRASARSVVLQVNDAGTRNAGEIKAAMVVEVLVLGGEEGVDDELGDGLDRDIEPPLAGVLGHQRNVSRVNTRHDRGFIVLQLGIIRKVFGKVPKQPGGCGNAHHKENRSCSKQEAEEAQKQPHGRMVPSRADLQASGAVLESPTICSQSITAGPPPP